MAYDEELLGKGYDPHSGAAALRREAGFYEWVAAGKRPEDYARQFDTPEGEQQVAEISDAMFAQLAQVMAGVQKPFTYGHPDFHEWTSQIDWDMRYDEGELTPSAVIDKMVDMGFTIIPPKMPPWALKYNTHTVSRFDSKEEAEKFVKRHLGNAIGYEVKEVRSEESAAD